MRLTHIKLAGFKSFVDPTVIPVPAQLTGVVGPNGCGKSNVIDAVRWVLGESSAKHLRGESMQDVIFNGSGTRKPASRASVELAFNNELGRAAGQWSQYAEIAVKRVLDRSGDSTYYINNMRVRRRDVADLFLGTGVGARAYAIIEQGMISRLIEAKPEELRGYLEEAAGVSKYKERRKETEARLKDARDNMNRVEDIQRELKTQVEKLAAQAEVAQHYKQPAGRPDVFPASPVVRPQARRRPAARAHRQGSDRGAEQAGSRNRAPAPYRIRTGNRAPDPVRRAGHAQHRAGGVLPGAVRSRAHRADHGAPERHPRAAVSPGAGSGRAHGGAAGAPQPRRGRPERGERAAARLARPR